MDAIAHHLALAYPEADKGVGISLLSMKEDMVGDVQPVLLVLLAAVAFLLLISCANVASLLLARSMSRSGEFALRASLGASRSRIIRQLLTESLLLAGLGGILGFLLALFGTKAIIRLLPGSLPRAGEVSVLDFADRASRLLPNESIRMRRITDRYIGLRYAEESEPTLLEEFAQDVKRFGRAKV